jgi:hypothetical protein
MPRTKTKRDYKVHYTRTDGVYDYIIVSDYTQKLAEAQALKIAPNIKRVISSQWIKAKKK